MSVEAADFGALWDLHEAALPGGADQPSWAEEADRAVAIVLGIADARGLHALPALRGDLLLRLCTDEGRAYAVAVCLAEWGYVSRYPEAFVRLRVVESDQWPTGF